jgi:hypothetical protein
MIGQKQTTTILFGAGPDQQPEFDEIPPGDLPHWYKQNTNGKFVAKAAGEYSMVETMGFTKWDRYLTADETISFALVEEAKNQDKEALIVAAHLIASMNKQE